MAPVPSTNCYSTHQNECTTVITFDSKENNQLTIFCGGGSTTQTMPTQNAGLEDCSLSLKTSKQFIIRDHRDCDGAICHQTAKLFCFILDLGFGIEWF